MACQVKRFDVGHGDVYFCSPFTCIVINNIFLKQLMGLVFRSDTFYNSLRTKSVLILSFHIPSEVESILKFCQANLNSFICLLWIVKVHQGML